MNLRLVSRQLGIISLLIGGFMVFSLPWAFPQLGVRNEPSISLTGEFETKGIVGLLASSGICVVVGFLLFVYGRRGSGHLFRKEAMAVVGLSWMLATVLGALPYCLSGTMRGPAVRMTSPGDRFAVMDSSRWRWRGWREKKTLSKWETEAVKIVVAAGPGGIEPSALQEWPLAMAATAAAPPAATLEELRASDRDWASALLPPDELGADGRQGTYRIRYLPMSFVDAMFESQSGFSTTGATVISELEDPRLVPHCILFWRSSTHFLGGLGIIVLFVVILGQGSAGKALMRAELPGPTQESSHARMQHAAWLFAIMYAILNVVLTIWLWSFGLTWFDALCHAFGTMATGGFSTYNASLGHFDNAGIEFTVIVFMILAGTNFTLLYPFFTGKVKALLLDVEWQTYMVLIFVTTMLVMLAGYLHIDFGDRDETTFVDFLCNSFRYGLFQVVSIITTTGYGTHDFNWWSDSARCALLLLMFVGGCAGSTGGGLKVIRHILFVKIIRIELEKSFHPTVVRPLRLAGQPVNDTNLRHTILVYFCVILMLFCNAWLAIVVLEPDATWGAESSNKLIDSASAVAATLNNIGPGLGTVGATRNYGHFNSISKIIFTLLMMLGRVEIYVILCLFSPRFWRSS